MLSPNRRCPLRRRLPMTSLLAAVALSLPALALPTVTAAAAPDSSAAAGASSRQLDDVIPAPVETTAEPAADFWLSPLTVIHTQPGSKEAKQVGDYLAGVLRPATSYPLPVIPVKATPLPHISLLLGQADARIG